MPDKKGIVFLIAGAVLTLSALLLFIRNQKEDAHAGQEAEILFAEVQSVISERAQPPAAAPDDPVIADIADIADVSDIAELPDAAQSAEPDATDQEPPAPRVRRYDYAGYLSLPSLGIELPVLATWDDSRLKLAPCRHFGSAETDDLVIAAHNYKSHFGRLEELLIGDSVTFVDMDGRVYAYSVVSIERVDPSEVETVKNSGHDLVLYTCTTGGQARVAAFCDREQAETLSPAG